MPNASFDALPFNGDSWTLIADGEATSLDQVPALFVLGNGFIGLRGPGEPAGCARVYLNGVYETLPISYHEAAPGYARSSDTRLAVADATALAISIDGTPLSDAGRLRLDLGRGLLVQTIKHGDVEIQIERLVSMTRSAVVATRVSVRSTGAPSIVAIRATVTLPPDDAAEAPAEDAPYDPRIGPGLQRSPWIGRDPIRGDGFAGRYDQLRRSGFSVVAIASAIDVELEAGAEPVAVESSQSIRLGARLSPTAWWRGRRPTCQLRLSRASIPSLRNSPTGSASSGRTRRSPFPSPAGGTSPSSWPVPARPGSRARRRDLDRGQGTER